MPELGEITRGVEVGYRSFGKFIWHACIDCGKERWVQFQYGKAQSQRCVSCAHTLIRLESGHYPLRPSRSGLSRLQDGRIILKRRNPQKKYGWENILRSRLVVEQYTSNPIPEGMIVHHINCIKDDDRPENLALLTQREHMILHGKMRNRKTLYRSTTSVKNPLLLHARFHEFVRGAILLLKLFPKCLSKIFSRLA